MSNMSCSDVTCPFCAHEKLYCDELLCNLTTCPDEKDCKYLNNPELGECTHIVKDFAYDYYYCTLNTCMYAD